MKNTITLLLFSFFSILFFNSFSQNTLNVTINGLEDGDSAKVKLTKGPYVLITKKAKNPVDKKVEVTFDDLSNGDNWVIAIDAPGYAYPTSAVISIPTVSSITIDITKYSSNNFVYEWQDDSSYVGHATQTYVNEPITLVVVDDTLKVPLDYSAIKLREGHGIILSNNNEEWSDEDSYRLFSNIERFEDIVGKGFSTNNLPLLNLQTGENLNSIWYLTNSLIDKDISIQIINNIKYVTLSRAALIYAEPLIVKLDGLRGKFYSKRLYKAMLNYFSDFGSDNNILDKIALNRFGFRWMIPNQETADLMGEPADHFQEFFPEEKVEILSMFEELPDGLHDLECNNYLIRRVNGQCHPTLGCEVPAIAWTSGVMEFLEKAFKDVSLSYLRRLILHEKSHFIWQCYLDQNIKDDWATIGGWYEDPLSSTGWSTSKTAEFVSAYAHLKNPNEDFAESVSYYVENVDALKSRSMQKYEFIRDRVMSGTRYIAQIRDDLSFTVYNLFPDYFYPGKIIGTKVEVKGEPDEDKTVKFTIKLKSDNLALDGASTAQTRFTSSIGTFYDVWLYPKNGSLDSVLTGEFTINKHAKAGYWKPIQIQVWDNVGNGRYENLNTVGVKAFVNNSLEDIVPPKYISYRLDTITALMSKSGEVIDSSSTGVPYKVLSLSTEWYDKSPMGRSLARLQFRNTAVYSRDSQINPPNESENNYNSIKKYKLYWAIPNYFPSDYYSTTFIDAEDIARNTGKVFFSIDTASFNDKPSEGLYKDLRDSILIEPPYPDTLAPLVDIRVGKITIDAEPVNLVAPDGETKVEIRLLVKDTSNYFGKEASITQIYYWLRDPQGVDHEFRFYPDGSNGQKTLTPDSAAYEWKYLTMNARLPKGSAPGKWGLSEINIWDKAGNQRRYSFVEYIRFDIIKSDVELTEPLYAEITGKVVNAYNVDSISAFITCSPCSELKYNYIIYSLMGGVVKTGEKVMGSDSVYVTDLDVSGIPDGVIKLTVQLKDTLDQLVATTTTNYTKDVIFPSAYYFQSNLQNLGSSNIDSLTITINTVEVNGEYELTVEELKSIDEGLNVEVIERGIKSEDILSGNQINTIHFENNLVIKKDIYTGAITNNILDISNIDLSKFTDGPIVINMVVTDSAFNIGTEIFSDTIYMDLSYAPIILGDTFSLAENSANATVIGTIQAADPDGDTLTYSIINGNSDQAFGLDSTTGQLTVADSTALDFEMTPVFGLLIEVSDGALSDSATFTINLTDVDEDSTTTNQAPTITSATYSLAENSINGTVLGMVEASDPNGDTLTYTIVSGNDAEAFSLDSESGELTVSTSSALDFETTLTYSLGVEVSDGALSDVAIFTINLTDVDEEEEEEILSLADASEIIYPNPSDGIINIKMAEFKEATVYNLSGKRIMRSTDNRIDVSALSEGVYIIKLENRSGDRFSTRLIKE